MSDHFSDAVESSSQAESIIIPLAGASLCPHRRFMMPGSTWMVQFPFESDGFS